MLNELKLLLGVDIIKKNFQLPVRAWERIRSYLREHVTKFCVLLMNPQFIGPSLLKTEGKEERGGSNESDLRIAQQ
jgi:hypothetical protein